MMSVSIPDFPSCEALHRAARARPRARSPFDWPSLPPEGVYCLFEDGEVAHGGDRIVYVGTHRAEGGLRAILKRHFAGSRRVSLLRKHIGAALLRRDGTAEDDVMAWESGAGRYDWVEGWVNTYLCGTCSFAVLPITEGLRRRLECVAAWLQLLAECTGCTASVTWLGHSASDPIVTSGGLWNVEYGGRA